MTVQCKACRRHAAADPANGWYCLSVKVPRDLAPKGFQWLGVFCSLACLARVMPDLRLQQLRTEDLYEHTPAVRRDAH